MAYHMYHVHAHCVGVFKRIDTVSLFFSFFLFSLFQNNKHSISHSYSLKDNYKASQTHTHTHTCAHDTAILGYKDREAPCTDTVCVRMGHVLYICTICACLKTFNTFG